MTDRVPGFWETFADSLKRSAARRNAIAYVPWWLILCAFGSGAIGYWLADGCEARIEIEPFVGAMSALLAVGGFLGALSIYAMSQVLSSVTEYPFSDFLKSEELFDEMIFIPQFIVLVQLIYIFMIALLIVAGVVLGNAHFHLIGLAFAVGLTLYVLSKTWGLVELIRRIAWHKEKYLRLYNEALRRRGAP